MRNNYKIVAKKVLDQIIEEASDKYAYNQYNKLWNKVNPYFVKLLTIRKYRKYKKEAQIKIMRNKYLSCFNIFQINLLFAKTQKRKKCVHYIYNYASTKIFSSYYLDMIRNIQ